MFFIPSSDGTLVEETLINRCFIFTDNELAEMKLKLVRISRESNWNSKFLWYCIWWLYSSYQCL